MKSNTSRLAIAALTLATLALPPAIASAAEGMATCGAKMEMKKCGAKCEAKCKATGAAMAKCKAKCAAATAKCAAKCKAKCAPKAP